VHLAQHLACGRVEHRLGNAFAFDKLVVYEQLGWKALKYVGVSHGMAPGSGGAGNGW
jgi:hypothetical protein